MFVWGTYWSNYCLETLEKRMVLECEYEIFLFLSDDDTSRTRVTWRRCMLVCDIHAQIIAERT